MIEIFGRCYPWGIKSINETMDKILNNAELILDFKNKTAMVKYKKEKYSVAWDYAEALVALNVVGCDSGNWETGERFYNIKER